MGSSLSGTNLERAGDYNQRVVLQAIRRHPEITRNEIAAITGLTAPTIANITARLFDAELIRSSGRRHGLRGQPPTRLAINPDGCFALGLNVDRDHVTLVALDLAGRVRSRFSRQLSFAMPDDVRAVFREGLSHVRGSADIDMNRVLGVGVALPDDLGRIELPHRPAGYDQWSGIDVAALLADSAAWPVHVDNDAAAAAIGEAQFGSGDHESFFYILISAGLGGGLVIDGAYYRGAQGRSGELGFLPLPAVKRGAGDLQTVVSLSALTAKLEQAGFDLGDDDPRLGLPSGSEHVVEAWVEDAADALGPALNAINCLINPDAVLISGRLPDRVLDDLAVRIGLRLQASSTAPVSAPIGRASLSQDAPAVGAAILPFLDRILPSDAILMK